MKTHPVQPARLTRNAQGVPFSEAYGDVYHPAGGALAQARHVFLEGNGLPERWQGRDRFVILETGFGLGNNFLATWDAWRSDPQAPRVLHFISLERHPLTRDDLAQVPRDHTLAGLAASLVEAWPPLTPNVHRLMFEGDRVELLLALGDVHEWLPQMVAHVDAFFLDGFAPARNPQMWQPALFKAMARMAAPGATFATWSAARAVRDGLTAAGFDVQRADGQGGKRDITVGRYAPRFTPRAAAARFGSRPAGHAVIVGAGLAGCGAARALAQEGWRCTVLDARDHPAQEGSGNPAGMFHGIVHADDGSHARFNRAAALAVRHAVLRAIEHGVPGGVPGLLRLETGIGVPAMQAVIERLGLPPEYVQALTPEAASAHAGVPLTHPAWLYPGGGWVSPAALSRHWLAEVGGGVRFVGGMRVGSLRQRDHGWEVLDAQGVSIETADVVILANAVDAARLAGGDWPQHRVRGQVSLVDPARLPIRRPRMPIAGAGYLVVPLQAPAVFGATAQPGDADESVREADHCYNLGQLQRLLDRPFDIGLDQLGGRTGWRCVVEDRLPLIGAVPDSTACNPPRDQARLVPRVPGLYVFAGMGSRGITWSALGARVLASWVTGAPAPVEADLLDAVDPARFVVRRLRRAAREPR